MHLMKASPLVVLISLQMLFSQATAAPRERQIPPDSPLLSPPILYRYQIDNVRSRISFTFRGLLIPYDGHFGVLGGEIFLGPRGGFRGAKADIQIESASVQTKNRAHLLNLRNQVLDVDRFPQIRLLVDRGKSDGDPIEYRKEREWRVKARGRLRMHGVEQEMPLRFRLTDTGAEIFVRGEGPVSLSRFNMSPPSVLLLVPGSDKVVVRVRIVAKPAPR